MFDVIERRQGTRVIRTGLWDGVLVALQNAPGAKVSVEPTDLSRPSPAFIRGRYGDRRYGDRQHSDPVDSVAIAQSSRGWLVLQIGTDGRVQGLSCHSKRNQAWDAASQMADRLHLGLGGIL